MGRVVIVMVPMPVPMVVPMSRRVIGAAGRRERGDEVRHRGTQAFQHGADDVVAQEQDAAVANLGGQMAVADVPGQLGQVNGVVSPHFVQVFGCSDDLHQRAVFKLQQISVGQDDRFGQVDERLLVIGEADRLASQVPVVMRQYGLRARAHGMGRNGGTGMDGDDPFQCNTLLVLIFRADRMARRKDPALPNLAFCCHSFPTLSNRTGQTAGLAPTLHNLLAGMPSSARQVVNRLCRMREPRLDTAPPPHDLAMPRDVLEPRADWPAELELRFLAGQERVRLYPRHVGPLRIQRPFYPEPDGTCHCYVLHPPGGVAGGDRLSLRIDVEAGARALLTAPGATRFYRAPDRISRQRIDISVAAGGVCEYLPMETIVFDGANARTEMEVRLAGDATFVGWDIVSLGRPAARERFVRGSFAQRSTILRDGRPVWVERIALEGESGILGAAYGLMGQPVYGTMVHAGPLPDEAVDLLRDRVPPPQDGVAAITRLRDVVLIRYCGPKIGPARDYFLKSWDGLRQFGQGKPASPPRIWAT